LSLLNDNFKGGEGVPLATNTRKNENFNINIDLNYLVELKGLINSNRILSISLAICLFSMAGIPPLVGFFSKQFVLFSSIESGANFISIVAILVSVISASYYLKLIRLTFFNIPENKESEGVLNENINEDFTNNSYIIELSGIQSYLISVLTLMIFFFFLNPSLLLNGTQLVSLTYFNF
jgi:NADH-ubiquinone oxidoreductase chain 2